MLVAVGSTNPAKISAVKSAFKKIFTQVEIVSFDVSSGVGKQPFGDKEAIEGAINRAKEAIKLGKADFGVGLEGAHREVFGFGFIEAPWFAVVNKDLEVGISGGGGFLLPEIVVAKLKEGKELGEIIDEITGTFDSKKKKGAVGFFTNNIIDRKKFYENYVIMAMSKFLHKDLYDKLT